MKQLRDVPLRYGVAALVCGGMSAFLFVVVFALLRQAYRVAESPAWSARALLASIVLVMGAVFALVAWAALSDPKSNLGSRFREKSADAAETFLALLSGEVLGWGVAFLSSIAFGYSIYLGAAVFLCWVLLLVLFFGRGLKYDVEALDDPNDNPRPYQLNGRSAGPGHTTIRTRAEQD
jgi:hypothetical protein